MSHIYFYLDDSPIYSDKYVIRIEPKDFPFPHGMRGSFNVLMARLSGLSYPNFLRYCRDRLGADLYGKGNRYVCPYFDKTPAVKEFVKLLNNRMTLIMDRIKNPYEYKEENGTIIRTPINL